ncbi:MAG: hypothetical protein IT348_06575 [Candidatus Eisenbacteria bacterium]|nr:hypothetical protein [Candidatus Eisenbacteria bacterium]
MTGPGTVLELNDLDLLLDFVSDPARATRLRRIGYALDGVELLARERARLLAGMERRWVTAYERAHARYGRGLTPVRGRVCQGCFVTLPTSAAPLPGESQLHQCESCGRLLLWG